MKRNIESILEAAPKGMKLSSLAAICAQKQTVEHLMTVFPGDSDVTLLRILLRKPDPSSITGKVAKILGCETGADILVLTKLCRDAKGVTAASSASSKVGITTASTNTFSKVMSRTNLTASQKRAAACAGLTEEEFARELALLEDE